VEYLLRKGDKFNKILPKVSSLEKWQFDYFAKVIKCKMRMRKVRDTPKEGRLL